MHKTRHLMLLLVIPFSCFIIFFTIPLLYGIVMSFYDVQGHFTGLTNYVTLFKDVYFWDSLTFTATYSLSVASLMTILGFFIGIFIHQLPFGQGVLKAIILIPWAISLTAWGIMAQIIISPHFGILNKALMDVGILKTNIGWLSSPFLAKLMIVVARVAKDVWFGSLLFLTARQLVPQELYDEGKVCGATAWKALWHITLPSLRATFLFVGTILFIFSLQGFDLAYALTRGGPGRATELVSLNIFRQGIQFGKYEYATAAATIWSLMITTIVSIVFGVLHKRSVDE